MAQDLPANESSSLDAAGRRRRRARGGLSSSPTTVMPRPPFAWRAREYQAAVFTAHRGWLRRFDLPWHRRAGKDRTGMAFTADRMEAEPGAYWHLFPKLVQAKRSIW